MSLTVSDIRRYPVKSCRGESVPDATVERWGLAGDRRWMLVGPDGETITARTHPRLVLIHPTWAADGGLDLVGPDGDSLHVSLPSGPRRAAKVHDSPVVARAADAAVSDWFSRIVGDVVALLYQDDPAGRTVSPDFGAPEDRVSFADAYPLLVTTTASLASLNQHMFADGGTGPPLPMTRFRPNVVIDGGTAWAEDGWRRLRIGAAAFRAVKGCARCVLTTIDPDTAEKGKEPIATLARHRRWDGKTWFGMNVIPDNPGARIFVGDEVEILEQVEDPDGPPR
jgi:uncharacterized protein YcbX